MSITIGMVQFTTSFWQSTTRYTRIYLLKYVLTNHRRRSYQLQVSGKWHPPISHLCGLRKITWFGVDLEVVKLEYVWVPVSSRDFICSLFYLLSKFAVYLCLILFSIATVARNDVYDYGHGGGGFTFYSFFDDKSGAKTKHSNISGTPGLEQSNMTLNDYISSGLTIRLD